MRNNSYAPHYEISRYSISKLKTGAEPFMVAMMIIIIIIIYYDEDEEAFLNGDRTDVWDETLGYYSDEEHYNCELDTNNEQSEIKIDSNGTGNILVHSPDGLEDDNIDERSQVHVPHTHKEFNTPGELGDGIVG